MTFQRFPFGALVATVFIAGYALTTSSIAQNAVNPLLQSSQQAVVKTEQVRAELLAWAPDGVAPGKQVWLGLQLAHQPDWHTYWKNSGDSGLPTELQWQLPPGITAGDIAWPTPQKIPLGTLANYGYEHVVLLPVPLTVAPDFKASQLNVKLKASWLVCRKECIPQDGDFSLSIPAESSTGASSRLFEEAFAATPKALPPGNSRVDVADKLIKVSLAGLPASMQGQTLAFFPETSGVIEPAGAWQQAWQGTLWTADVPLSAQRTESPGAMPLVVSFKQEAYRIEAPVTGPWPDVTPAATVSPALQAALQANASHAAQTTTGAPIQAPGAPTGLMAALLAALLGGMILNLMPCVFPVLAIKVVGFVQVKDTAKRISGGLAYSVGVVLSFLALGALLLALRAAGEQLGWGFQLQSPAVVAGLAALFTLLGLNLAGVFEFGSLLPSRIASFQAKNPTVDSFLSGVLATAIASPCTAPFMGASLGYAVGLPALQALAIFAALGVGMALPYLLISALPGVARLLPRPGAWMVIFKQLMAFPMFATVAWLIWVLGQQSGIDGAGTLLLLLVLMALALWALSLQGRTRTALATISIAMCALAVWGIGSNVIKPLDAATPMTATTGGWQTWEPGRVEQLASQGQAVFVDFTAAWCVTCQYNKKTTLSNADVLADMQARNVAMLRADWTRRDPAVTAALSQLGRSGVPVYVIYKPGHAPVVLSEVLSVDMVRSELAKL